MTRYSPVSPVFQVPNISVDDEFLVDRAIHRFEAFQSDRIDWLERRAEMYLNWDDYLSPTRKGLYEGSSNYHFPQTEARVNQMHARLLQSIFFTDEIFFIDVDDDLTQDRVKKIKAYMKYIILRGCNYNKGLYNAIDDFCWDLASEGMAILEKDWVVEQRRFIDVVRNPEFEQARLELDRMLEGDIDEDEFEILGNSFKSYEFIETPRIRTVFNGSTVRAIDPSHVLFKGDVVDSTDLNLHETVIKICRFTEEQLLQFKYSEYFDEDAVDIILDGGPDSLGTSYATSRNTSEISAKDYITGIKTLNPMAQDRTYEMLCLYDTTGVKPNSKFRDRLVYFVHPKSRQLARWTFLDRIDTSGMLPLYMGHLYRRPRRSIGRGIVETNYPFNETIDILINQGLDAGSLANNPMLKYKGDDVFDPGTFKIEPGLMVKCDDPAGDLLPINFNLNTNWALPFIQLIRSASDEVMSLGPQSSGQVSGRVGPLRSASGVQEMLAQGDIQIDVLIKRVNDPISQLLYGLYCDNVERMPDKLKVSLIGQDGKPLLDESGAPLRLEMTRDELRLKVRFGLYANSALMNKITKAQSAMRMGQFLFQPIALQSQVVKPHNIYNTYDYILSCLDIPGRHRFISETPDIQYLSLEQEIAMIMQGVEPMIGLADPAHEQKIEAMSALIASDKAAMEVQHGYVHPKAFELLKAALGRHMEYAETMANTQNLGNTMTGSNEGDNIGADAPESAGEQPAGEGVPNQSMGGQSNGGVMQ